MAIETAVFPQLEEFFDEGLVSEVVTVIESGKEATACLVRGTKKLGVGLAVAKVYHERNRRNFRDQSAYTAGRVILKGQVRRAVEKGTAAGREFEAGMWLNQEFEVLSALEYAGADVPAPYFCGKEALLMGYVADAEGNPAPQLQYLRLEHDEAGTLIERLLWNVETWLACNVIHADLSAYNVLYANGAPTIIDFPQAVDPRFSPNARDLLARDLANVARYAARCGVELDHERTCRDLWNRFRHGEL